jgi:PilZ domain-containing protein
MDQRPRSPRIPVEFPLTIEGTNESGHAFQVKGTAVKISHAGATIMIDVDIPVGSKVTLVQASGAKLAAEVNGSWIDDLDGTRRIGVRLLETNGWFA